MRTYNPTVKTNKQNGVSKHHHVHRKVVTPSSERTASLNQNLLGLANCTAQTYANVLSGTRGHLEAWPLPLACARVNNLADGLGYCHVLAFEARESKRALA